jgi:hypothetical protein
MIHSRSSHNHAVRRLGGSLRAITFCGLGLLVLLTIGACVSQPNSDHQKMIHEMGSQVMPFDLSKTRHIFEMTENGGIQKVVVRDEKDVDQLAPIRQHLMHESMRFSEGDFSDPTSLHGKDMPGIQELSVGASQIRITYSELPNGAQIDFVTEDLKLITAIHKWFGAQLSDHGSDASYR